MCKIISRLSAPSRFLGQTKVMKKKKWSNMSDVWSTSKFKYPTNYISSVYIILYTNIARELHILKYICTIIDTTEYV